MLVGIIGDLGAGKTATLAYISLYRQAKGRTIYSNFKLGCPYHSIQSIFDLQSIRFGDATLDELWSWVDSRTSMSEKNQAISSILLTSRKRGVNVFYTAQRSHQIDRRLRDITNYWIFPEIMYVSESGDISPIVQHLLDPVDQDDLLPYLAVYSDICVAESETSFRKIDELDPFWLSEIVGKYDTTEEIGRLDSPKEVGMRREQEFADILRKLSSVDEVTVLPESGGGEKHPCDVVWRPDALPEKRIDCTSTEMRKNAAYISLKKKNMKVLCESPENYFAIFLREGAHGLESGWYMYRISNTGYRNWGKALHGIKKLQAQGGILSVSDWVKKILEKK